MTYAIMAAVVASLVAYLAAKSANDWRSRYKDAEEKLKDAGRRMDRLEHLYKESTERRHALEKDLAALRSGSPSDRVSASLDILRDESEATGAKPRKPAPGVADLTAAARKP